MSEISYSAQILIRKKYLTTMISSPGFKNDKIGYLETPVHELQEKIRNSTKFIDNLVTKLGQGQQNRLAAIQ